MYLFQKKDNNFTFESEKHVKDEIQGSGKKMVLTTFSSALVSELDIVLLGLFYAGPTLGVLAWSRRILEIIFQLLAASLDILFPELAKAQSSKDVNDVRYRLRKVFLFSFSIPILFLFFSRICRRYIYFYYLVQSLLMYQATLHGLCLHCQ